MVMLSAWFIGGLFLDGWAHNHLAESLETFFTPWHGVFYAGFFAVAGFLVFTVIRNLAQGFSGFRAVPAGYELSVVGAMMFFVGGVGDMLWHMLLGIEADVEALLSPPHLLLAFSMALIFTGPLRAAWRRPAPESGHLSVGLFPMLFSTAITLSLLTFFTQYANPIVETWTLTKQSEYYAVPDGFKQELGVSAFLIYTVLLTGTVLLLIRRWSLPVGSLTLLFTLNAAGMSAMQDEYRLIPAAFLAGVVADVLLWWLRPSADRPGQLRWFAFAVPALFALLLFASLWLAGQLAWSVHLWAGTVFLVGLMGWLLSFLSAPPKMEAPTATF